MAGAATQRWAISTSHRGDLEPKPSDQGARQQPKSMQESLIPETTQTEHEKDPHDQQQHQTQHHCHHHHHHPRNHPETKALPILKNPKESSLTNPPTMKRRFHRSVPLDTILPRKNTLSNGNPNQKFLLSS